MKNRQPVPTAAELSLSTDRRYCSKGFTLAEMLLVLALMCVLMLISIPIIKTKTQMPDALVVEQIVMQQFDAIMENERKWVDREDISFSFNRIGNVSRADHFTINRKTWIISLGTGRIYEED